MLGMWFLASNVWPGGKEVSGEVVPLVWESCECWGLMGEREEDCFGLNLTSQSSSRSPPGIHP